MEIIDTAGTDQFEAMRDLYLKTGDAFVIVFSVQDRTSLREAEDIMHQIKRIRGQSMVSREKLRPSIVSIRLGADDLGGKQGRPERSRN